MGPTSALKRWSERRLAATYHSSTSKDTTRLSSTSFDSFFIACYRCVVMVLIRQAFKAKASGAGADLNLKVGGNENGGTTDIRGH